MRLIDSRGYWLILDREHSRSNHKGYVFEHIVIAEKALGYSLPKSVEIHHVNETPLDNAHTNLVICQDRAYHRLLHQRQRVLNAGGNPNTDKLCCACKGLQAKIDFHLSKRNGDGRTEMCKSCTKIRASNRRKDWTASGRCLSCGRLKVNEKCPPCITKDRDRWRKNHPLKEVIK